MAREYLIKIDTGPQIWVGKIEADSEADAKRIAREAVSRGEWPHDKPEHFDFTAELVLDN